MGAAKSFNELLWGDQLPEIEALVSSLEDRWRDGARLVKAFPREATVRGVCPDCGLERTESIAALLEQRLGEMTLWDLTDSLKCERGSCGGKLDYEIE
ncbi:hypothetical protein [Asticcacaulis sp. YBE204]|uniref:hypothetical protein n=1 Tax=Asticcacaulis sp. YBE204 TaxID=1282363 RepID=UPI0003C3CD82|nr:hypothetical protein [Asticcacaulis sp. YBE204]ESQ78472.1 hypothetical protein AEYBE204_13030 [Asticcacaulis sp. YBE204]